MEEKFGQALARLAAESFGQDCGCIVSGRRAGGQIEFASSPVTEGHFDILPRLKAEDSQRKQASLIPGRVPLQRGKEPLHRL
ncbi:hypothetical protein B5F76_07145, partial [Desulfovibrio sp. An276]